jgi:predicted peroxiredoxin
MSSVLIVVTHGPDTPEMCGAPFLYAQDAAALGCATEMFFTTNGTRLMKKGVAESVFPKAGGKSIQQFIEETVAKGVKLLVCQPSLQLNSMTEDDLIDQVDTLVSTAYLITQGLKADLVLSF